MARILTFDLSWLSPVFLTVGIFLFLSRRKSQAGQIGRVLIGLGIILMALRAIVSATQPIVQSETTQILLNAMESQTLLALIFGMVLAILCYSSLAAVILTAAAAASGHLGFETALTLVVGANLGSCVLEILGSSGQGMTARRVMAGNTAFKLTIALIVLPCLPLLSAQWIKLPISEQIIWFHVLFNAAVCVLLLPAVGLYAKALTAIFRDPEPLTEDESVPMYLDEAALENPQLALSNALRETLRLGGFVHELLGMLCESFTGKTSNAAADRKVRIMESLSSQIRLYLEEIETQSGPLNERWHQIFSAAISAVHAADVVRRMQNEVISVNKSQELNISAHSRADLIKLVKEVNSNLSLALNAFMSRDPEDLEEVLKHKSAFKALTDRYSVRELGKILPVQTSENDGRALVLMLISDLRQLDGIVCSIASSRWAQMRADAQHQERTFSDEK